MSQVPQIIETLRLKLRPPSLDDAASIFEQYAQDREVTKYMTWQPHANVETTYQFLQQAIAQAYATSVIAGLKAQNHYLWVILPKNEAKALGCWDVA
ncbi:MAG: GNAT family N-acetyltransferase [Waterburya sp.]